MEWYLQELKFCTQQEESSKKRQNTKDFQKNKNEDKYSVADLQSRKSTERKKTIPNGGFQMQKRKTNENTKCVGKSI